jgi:hypothetical protein
MSPSRRRAGGLQVEAMHVDAPIDADAHAAPGGLAGSAV